MSLDLGHSRIDEMLKRSAMDFMRGDAPKLVVEELLETDTGMDDGMWKKMAGLGWLGILIPDEYGGAFHKMTSAGVVLEAMGSGPLPGPYFSSSILGTRIILEAADDGQKQAILPRMVEGDMVLTLAMTEAEYSWEPVSLSTRALETDKGFVINGVKLFVHDATSATHFIVAAKTADNDNLSQSLSLFMVAADTPGIGIRRLPGFLSGRTFEVTFNGAEVPPSALLGNKDQGWPHLERSIAMSIPPLCAYKVGGCQAVLDMTLEYSRGRVQFGTPIGRFQRVQDMIIEIVNHADAARWATYEALWKQDTVGFDPESIHLAKTLASEGYWQACTLGHQVFSGLSYSMEHQLSFHTRTSRYLYDVFGDPGFHRRKLGNMLVPQEG
jgi:alkylation response protein AidB-like acyl-CoA dehydrogenase